MDDFVAIDVETANCEPSSICAIEAERVSIGCIKAVFKVYQMDCPAYEFLCALQKARRTIPHRLCSSFSLPALCAFLGIPFNNHHNALADAEACEKIALSLL